MNQKVKFDKYRYGPRAIVIAPPGLRNANGIGFSAGGRYEAVPGQAWKCVLPAMGSEWEVEVVGVIGEILQLKPVAAPDGTPADRLPDRARPKSDQYESTFYGPMRVGRD